MSTSFNEHVSAERLQALLDGAVPVRERARVEEHLAVCPRCAEELEGWRGIFEELATLAQLQPHGSFQERVIAAIATPAPIPLRRRLGRRLLALLPSPHPEHATDERLQDYLDGALPARVVTRLESHLAGCAGCAGEVAAWRAVYARIDVLEPLGPGEGFADRVLAGVRISALPARSQAVAGLRAPDWRRALAFAVRFVPRTRRAWAALSGVALTPAVTVGLVLYTVFSHPTLTPQALTSFVIWKASDLLSVTWSALGALAFDAGQSVGVDTIVSALFEAPFMLAGGALAYSLISVLALRVLYKNLLAGHRHARLSHS